MVVDRPSVPKLLNAENVHSPGIENSKQRSDGETPSGEETDGIICGYEVEKTDRHRAEQDCKVCPLS